MSDNIPIKPGFKTSEFVLACGIILITLTSELTSTLSPRSAAIINASIAVAYAALRTWLKARQNGNSN
jgi:hypothetical protein